MIFLIEKAILKSHIKRKVKRFANDEPVHFIQAGFGIVSFPLFTLYFDTSEAAGPDGSWTTEIWPLTRILLMPHWRFYRDEGLQAARIVELIKSAMLECREAGVFNSLNFDPNCDFGIEELDGLDGWPEHKDRGKENLIAIRESISN